MRNFKPCKWRESRSIWQELELRYRLLHRWDGVDGVDSVDGWKVNFPVLRNLAVLLSYQACDFCETALAFFLKRNLLQVSVQRQEQVVAGQVKQKARLELLLQRSCDFWYFFSS